MRKFKISSDLFKEKMALSTQPKTFKTSHSSKITMNPPSSTITIPIPPRKNFIPPNFLRFTPQK